jgi:single-stranded-DNA-specific exonuclease
MNGWLKKWILPAGVPSGTLMQRIAIVRGIPASALPKFIAPTFGDLAPPKELHGAVEVGERLAAAVRAGRKVAIFGDYDADGMCASAILLHLIRAARPNDPPIVYIPERATEGYGLSVAAIQHLASIGVQTIISVD